MNGPCWLSRLLLCTLAVSVAAVKDAIITLPGGTSQLRSAIADWGYQFNRTSFHASNLMLPPEEDDGFGQYLCTYPSSLNDTYLPPGSLARPIALLVSRGHCSFEQKAQVALALQQNYTGVIKYVIISNNDTENYSELIGLESKTDFPSLGFLSISTRAGSHVMTDIFRSAEGTNTNPYLSASINDLKDWDYLIEIQRWDTTSPGGGSNDSSSQNAFYWLRFVLFTLLILSPCLRAFYLWWSAGGRFVLARNERGRIVGLRVVRPAPYWFATHGGAPVQPASRRLLTEEQVKALPEITFVPPPRSAQDHDDEDNNDDDQASIHGQATINLDNDEEQGQAIKQDTEPEIHLPPQTDSDPEIRIRPSTDQEEEEGVILSTSCTTCSICIDDFEAGERIRLLPKCHHAFHTDCIMPWLTERQGCCPLCKTAVLDGGEEESDTAVAGDTAVASDTAVANDAAVASNTAVASEAPNVHTQRRPDDSPA